MTFTRDPVVSSTFLMRMENPLVAAITFSETNGRAELTLQGRVPLLAKFESGGSAIDIVAAPTEAQSPQPAAAPPPPTLQSLTARPPFTVMLDAGHGGDDRGALLSDMLEEKAVTLFFARRLRSELQNRGINAVMTRDADVSVPLDQRAAMADAARAAIYVTLHAASQGRGVRIYTAMLTSAAKPTGFIPWDTAQAGYLPASRSLAEIVKAEMAKHQIPGSDLSAPVRPLNNVAAAAIAVELSPSDSDAASLNAAAYQQRVAGAVAEAVVVARARVEAER
jgi:N-acetylmuramoyl-L-alanine amidase